MFNVYSMVSIQEREKLYELARTYNFEEFDTILEFGVFFGGSSEALALGLAENPTFYGQNILSLDSFNCPTNGAFYPILMQRAAMIYAVNQLKFSSTHVDWLQFVKNNLNIYPQIQLIQMDARDYKHNDGPIALLHLDLPKFFDEMYTIFKNVMSHIKDDAFILFQDFFYHWSAETIGFVYYLIKKGAVRIEYTSGGTLATKRINLEMSDIDEFKNLLSDYNSIINLLIECVEFMSPNVTVIQKEFLYMAVFQYAYFHKDYKSLQLALKWINHPNQNKNVLNIYNELQNFDFNLKKLYQNELDDYAV